MLSEKRILDFLREFCQKNGIPFEKADKQLCAIGEEALLCVEPDKPDLAHDTETLMLPTLIIREKNGELVAVETEYTKEFLFEGE
ncbi:MAG: hypothetical protein IJG87_06505 [Ruminococcus sp.]|nr:hypothetical protein [Ruminococcus sp.]